MKIINMLNELYTLFDALCDAKRIPNIYKVETVGDKYMAVSGLPENCDSHARWIAKLALGMMDVAKNVRMGNEQLVNFWTRDAMQWFAFKQFLFYRKSQSESTQAKWLQE